LLEGILKVPSRSRDNKEIDMLVTRRRLKECEVQRDIAIGERDEYLRQRDIAIGERNEFRRQLDQVMQQLDGANDEGTLQIRLRRALQERDQARRDYAEIGHLYESARNDRDAIADQNRTLKIECDRYREERDQAYGWVDRADREIIELRTENERLRAGSPRK
jgi:hypothetical protein